MPVDGEDTEEHAYLSGDLEMGNSRKGALPRANHRGNMIRWDIMCVFALLQCILKPMDVR